MFVINLNNNLDLGAIKKNKRILHTQYLPVKIDSNGKANINNNFNIYAKNENQHLINALRGRLLRGKRCEVPKNYHAIALQGISSENDNVNKTVYVKGTFDEFLFWEYDKALNNYDVCTQICNISKLSSVLHAPLEEKDMNAN